jgi:hypothetical protein
MARPTAGPTSSGAALRNRRRIATEAMRLRRHLEQRLDADPDTAVIVLGDLYDGPGQDYFEELYLAHNTTDILVGSPYRSERLFHHAQADVARPTATARCSTTSSPGRPTSSCCWTIFCCRRRWPAASWPWPRFPGRAGSSIRRVPLR